MSAEQLIALETALNELGRLYVAARSFVPLHVAAEAELLPLTQALGARLRAALREHRFGESVIAEVAQQIATLRGEWQNRLDGVRGGPAYQRALAAWHADHTEELLELLPALIAGLAVASVTVPLYAPVSAAAGRRGGAHPFLSATAYAEKIAGCRTEGIPPETAGNAWWEAELGYVTLVEAPDSLETPAILRLEPPLAGAAVFAAAEEAAFRAYGRRLRLPFSVCVRETMTDEWWAASEPSYEEFRDALAGELTQRSFAVTVCGEG
jgi:hypothetical protein